MARNLTAKDRHIAATPWIKPAIYLAISTRYQFPYWPGLWVVLFCVCQTDTLLFIR